MTAESFISQCKELRRLAGWSQGDLASELGVRRHATVSDWERGETTPTLNVQRQVGKMLDTHRKLNARSVDEERLLREEIASYAGLLPATELRKLHAYAEQLFIETRANSAFGDAIMQARNGHQAGGQSEAKSIVDAVDPEAHESNPPRSQGNNGSQPA